MVIGPTPAFVRTKVFELPVSAAADPTTILSKTTCTGFISMNGAELIAVPVRVTGCEVEYPPTPLTVPMLIDVVWTPGVT